jgi:AbrB family looped-hinge helix DNA binding protein
MHGEDPKIASSRVTAQGQISVPAEVRRRLGIGPGSVIEWDDDGEKIIVRRAGQYSSTDVHQAVFPRGAPKRRSLEELKAGIRSYMGRRHARR